MEMDHVDRRRRPVGTVQVRVDSSDVAVDRRLGHLQVADGDVVLAGRDLDRAVLEGEVLDVGLGRRHDPGPVGGRRGVGGGHPGSARGRRIAGAGRRRRRAAGGYQHHEGTHHRRSGDNTATFP
jgi:hypothetical protein